MLPYLHTLFEAFYYGGLPKRIEVCGVSGSGKTTTLVQLGWEYQQMFFHCNQGKSPTVNYIHFQAVDGANNTVGEDLMEFHIRSHSNIITTHHPSLVVCPGTQQLEYMAGVLRDMEGIVLIDGLQDVNTLTCLINAVGPKVEHFAYVAPYGVKTYQCDSITCVYPGHCFFDCSLEDDDYSEMSGVQKLAREEQLRVINQSHFGPHLHYRREHNALFQAYLNGKAEQVVDDMVRCLTEQKYGGFTGKSS